MGGPVLLGPRQAWEAATWGKQLSQPHTLAAFPWLHCVLAPKGSVALSTAGTVLALTLKATPRPRTPAATYRSHFSRTKTQTQAMPHVRASELGEGL